MIDHLPVIESLMVAFGTTVALVGLASSVGVAWYVRTEERRMYLKQHRTLERTLRQRRAELRAGEA